MINTAPVLTVIVPAYRAAGMLRACLDGLAASNLPREQWELIVVDDGSDDATPDVGRATADVLLTVAQGPRGPAQARNMGAARARGRILVFVDADVVVAPTTLAAFVNIFEQQTELAAAFGAYDETPADSGFISQFRNLLHRYVHLQHPGSATTFWTGCSAVQRDAFLAVGGFDAQRYPRPQVEDIDLGYRLTDRGYRILLAPEIIGKHLKRWTFSTMIRTDFCDRAVPWMHLLMERRAVASNGALNLEASEKLYTLLAGVAALCLLLLPWNHQLLWVLLAALSVVIAGNARLIAWFARQRGWRFALGAAGLRMLHYLVGGSGAAWGLLTYHRQSARAPLSALPADNHRTAAQ
jgi:glycosyltransferase involved in cell wall biosynthesis